LVTTRDFLDNLGGKIGYLTFSKETCENNK